MHEYSLAQQASTCQHQLQVLGVQPGCALAVTILTATENAVMHSQAKGACQRLFVCLHTLQPQLQQLLLQVLSDCKLHLACQTGQKQRIQHSNTQGVHAELSRTRNSLKSATASGGMVSAACAGKLCNTVHD
jgi:hypothetical protein